LTSAIESPGDTSPATANGAAVATNRRVRVLAFMTVKTRET
jgi:hypothetical protein